MCIQSFTELAPKPPFCPYCARTMRLRRVTARFDDLPDLYTFECASCGLSHIEAAHIKAADMEAAYGDTIQAPLSSRALNQATKAL